MERGRGCASRGGLQPRSHWKLRGQGGGQRSWGCSEHAQDGVAVKPVAVCLQHAARGVRGTKSVTRLGQQVHNVLATKVGDQEPGGRDWALLLGGGPSCS